MVKKILSLLSITLLAFILISCSDNENKLYVLNVGDYINSDVLERFEEEFDCKVVYTETNSNEEIYQKLKNENYDICVVSDYMIDRMYKEGLIQELDYSRIPNYSFEDLFDSSFGDGSSDAQTLINEVALDSYKNYFIPYFWGTLGILYNTLVVDEEELEEKGMSILFEENDYNKGMYNSARDALAAAMIAYNELNSTDYDINEENEEAMRLACSLLKNTTYRAWGDDNLKAMVSSGMLDLALVYSGDYFDELYQCEADGLSEDEITFSYYAPSETNIWFDGMVLTSNSKNTDLAYEFFNFFQDIDNAAENADYIGYMPLNKKVFDVLAYSENYAYFLDDDGNELSYEDDLYVVRTNVDGIDRSKYLYRFVSVKHYNLLNDLLDESKS